MGVAREGTDFLVRRDNWRRGRFDHPVLAEDLSTGQVLLRVDRFALTSNNISYAMAGDMLGYWNFFPAEKGWGRIPVMGFGEVLRSAHPEIAEGERVFGFFPMSKHLVVQADEVAPGQFSDAASHRSATAPVYRQYIRSAADPLYEEKHEDALMLLRGLFMTSFLVDDFIAENDFFGAESFVISSASSKTALALAYQLSQRSRGRVIGLTSERNRPFVESLGFYDATVLYDEIESLPSESRVVFVDHSGNGSVVNRIHRHFSDNLRYSCSVGGTHWEAGQPRDESLPGATPTFFFAPAQLQKRGADWGPQGLRDRLGGAWQRFLAASDSWLTVVRDHGEAALERVYGDVLEGRARPNEGHVLSLWDRSSG